MGERHDSKKHMSYTEREQEAYLLEKRSIYLIENSNKKSIIGFENNKVIEVTIYLKIFLGKKGDLLTFIDMYVYTIDSIRRFLGACFEVTL
jgi:hypothetical protein